MDDSNSGAERSEMPPHFKQVCMKTKHFTEFYSLYTEKQIMRIDVCLLDIKRGRVFLAFKAGIKRACFDGNMYNIFSFSGFQLKE